MKQNRFKTFSKIFTFLIIFGAILSLVACKDDKIEIESLTVSTADNVSTIAIYHGTLQMLAVVLPEDATDPSVVWSVQNGTGSATISATGLLTAVSNGTVTVKATSVDDDTMMATKVITLSHQEVVVSSVTVSSADDQTTIEVKSGTLQMSALVLPADAADKTVVWTVENGTGAATINASGLLTAVSNGTVTVKATATADSTMFDEMEITLSNQEVVAASISMSSALDQVTITSFGGTLQMTALVLPANTVDKSVVWSVVNGTGQATITQNGLLTAVANGTVTVKVASTTNALVFDEMEITISHQEVLITSISVTGYLSATTISTFGGTLQMVATILPANADDQSVLWTVENGTGEATISETGLLTAVANGTVVVTATSANQPLIQGARTITLSNQDVLATSVEVSSAGNAVLIETFGGTLQFSVIVLPADTDDKSVIWSVTNGTGEATISETGLLTAVANGTVTVKAASATDALVFGTKVITISHQEVLATSVEVLSALNVSVIDTFGGTLQFSVNVLPANTEDKSVIWSVISGTGEATISETGLLTALSDGTVTVKATATTDALIFGTKEITLSNQTVLVSSISISGALDAVIIDTFGGTLQFTALVLPANAENKAVTWSVENGTGSATISATGLLTAVSNGIVTVTATSDENALILDSLEITLSNQTVLVESISLSGAADAVMINTFGGTLQITALVLPIDAENKAVTWSVENGTGEATISATGLLTAVSDGTVTVKATSDENLEIFGTLVITLSNQAVLVSSVSLTGAADAIIIDTFGGTLQITALVLPADAENKAVTWSVENGTGEATISATGLLTAVANGTVTVKATSDENALIFGTLVITLSHQEILAESIVVSSEGDVIVIDVEAATLQMYAEVLPVDAVDQLYTWSVENGTGAATISELGLLTALSNGTVTVIATLNSNELIYDSLVINISNQSEVIITANVNLLSAEDFTILSKTGISTTSGTLVTGNLGVSPSPASYITGFDLIYDASNEFATSSLVVGMIYAADLTPPTPTYLSTAVLDMQAAYTDAAGRAPDFTELYAGDISGQTLVPGVYYWSSGLLIATNVTLSGSATDVWIFQIAGSLTQSPGVSILLNGGAVASNIVWQVSSGVAIGVGSHFEGTILGMTSVDLGTNASYNGKIFAQTAVTLDSNIVN